MNIIKLFFLNITINAIIILLAITILNINLEPNEQYYKNNQCSYK